MDALFAGLKVLDLSTVLAGPSVGSFFAELGAEVTKIENPVTKGDVTRSWKIPGEDPACAISAYFASVNYGKKYLWLDLSKERDKLDDHLREADIVIANFKVDDYKKFRLEEEHLHAINPKLIIARLKGFDSDEHRVAYDIALQAETGFMFMNGTRLSGPVKMPVALIDVLAAHQLKEGILCALLQRERTGKGMAVDCSLEMAGLASLMNQAGNYLMTGYVPQRLGSLHPNIAPYGEVFECSDKKEIVLAVGSDKQFRKLCELLGVAELADDDRFNSNQKRVAYRVEMHTLFLPSFTTKTREEWITLFIENDIPSGAIRSMDEVMLNPVAKSMIRKEEIEGVQTSRLSGIGFRLS